MACIKHQRLVHVDAVEQPFHRPLPAPRDAFLHFAGLLGDMKMNRRCKVVPADRVRGMQQLLAGHGPQGVGRDTDAHQWIAAVFAD